MAQHIQTIISSWNLPDFLSVQRGEIKGTLAVILSQPLPQTHMVTLFFLKTNIK